MRQPKNPNTSLAVLGLTGFVLLLALALSYAGIHANTLIDFTPTAYVHLPLILRQPTPTATTPPQEGWLAYINYYRAMAQLPAVTANATWCDGCWKHSRYMVKNQVIVHGETPGTPWYTQEGNECGTHGNAMISSDINATDEEAIDLWMQGPFHAVGIIDPELLQVGYGSYREAVGTWQMGATLDVLRGLGSIPPSVTFPVKWPSDGTTVFLNSYSGTEMPDPLSSCSGYSAPSGLPIILQLGSGSVTPNVTAHSFMQGSTALDHCVFDETNYTNSDPGQQDLGRSVLGGRNAIVLIPRAPLTPGAAYTASITVNGQTYTWSFTVSSTAQTMEEMPKGLIR